MEVFYHLVYEYQKGLRDLCLFTCVDKFFDKIKKILEYQKIDYLVLALPEDKINIFFGLKDCIDIVKSFSSEELNLLAPEEDFILGMMLGYSRQKQYSRFLKKKNLIEFNQVVAESC